MLELIPTLLVDQVVKPLDVNRPMTALSQLVVKQVETKDLRRAAIAAPESFMLNLLPTALVAPSSLATSEIQTSFMLTPAKSEPSTANPDTGLDRTPDELEPASLPQATPSVQPAATPVADAAENNAGVPRAATQPTTVQTEGMPPEETSAQTASTVAETPTIAAPAVLLGTEPKVIPIAVPAPESSTKPPATAATERADDRNLVPTEVPAPVASIVPNQTAIAERKKEIEQKLAEIVAKDRQRQAATQPANLVASAIEYAQQGDFERARAVMQDPAIPTATQTEVMSRIAALQLVETPSLPSPDQASPSATPKVKQIFVPKPEQASQAPSQVLGQEAAEIRGLLKQAPTLTPKPTPATRLSADDAVMRSQQFDLPAPQTPQFNPPGATAQGAGNYSTTPIDGQIATRSPLPGLPGNGNLRLLYPLPTPAPVTSPFGWRVHPVTGQRRLHTGTDIGAAAGTPILAAYSGKVSTADQLGGYGLAVVVEHNNGSQDTLYAHMSEILVRPGQWVEQGAVIGRVGSTGMSTGPHLHFELRQKTAEGWQTLDPGPVLQAAKNELVRTLQSAQVPQQLASPQGTL